ncbi:MAG: sugar ABC transporter permease [Fimbriimonas sp.]|nr:sugar ABC transporter permease [Fimbriimonas sp.]
MKSITKREAWAGYLFASPWLLGFLVFMSYPLIASIYFSLCDYSVLKSPVWVGIDNYKMLMHDELFRTTLANTFLYAAIALPAGMATAIILAMLLNAKVKGMALYRTFFFIPSLVPQVSLAILWRWVLDGEHGVLNPVLAKIGIHGPNWLNDPLWAKPSLVLMAMWGVGNAMLIYLAGLQDVPTQLIEASELDGANGWQKTKHVTLPMISPVILFNGIMGIIGSLQVFTVPYIMFPGGAPVHSTYFYTEYLYDNAFRYHKMGYASAMGWIMFIVILVLTMLSLRMSEKHVHYQGS